MGIFKGTPGSWYHDANCESKAIFHPTEIGTRLAIVDETFIGVGINIKKTDEWKANAQLIAAAPDLLKALIMAEANLRALATERWGEHWIVANQYEPIYKAQSAISKALGEGEGNG